MTAGSLGQIVNPASGNRVMDAVEWCGDNAVFADKYPGDPAYLSWLDKRSEYRGRCWFATAPDVVGDAVATVERSMPMLPRIRRAGFPAALVAQDGIESITIPWDEFDTLFLGGTTEWKLGEHARQVTADAKRRGKRVHMGRVNSRKRLKLAHEFGCDSVDGTYLAFGPDKNLPRLLQWLSEIDRQSPLF